MEVELDRRNNISLVHETLKQKFYAEIGSGRWALKAKIPSENDLARDFEVSRGTVRKALKSLETEGILQKATKGHGRIVIRPVDRKAGRLTKNIGIILHELTSDYYGDILSTQQAARQRGYDLVIYVTRDGAAALSSISQKHLDGLLVYCQEVLNMDIFEFSKYFPTVALYHNCTDNDIPSYYIDWPWAVFDLASHLFKEGLDNQILILPRNPAWNTWNASIVSGFRYAHLKQGIKFDRKQLMYTPFNTGNEERKEFLCAAMGRVKKGRSTGFISLVNWPTVHIIDYALKHGLKVPDEIAVAALMNTKLLGKSKIPITAYSFDLKEIAKQALCRLLDTIEGRDITDEDTDNPFYGELIIRESSSKNVVNIK